MALELYDRFKDAPWFSVESNNVIATVGGSGGIGSWLTIFLVRAGFKPILYDFDTVESHNLGGQLFTTSDIGFPKVTAVSKIVKALTGLEIDTYNEAITEFVPVTRFCFSAFDNMASRKILFENWLETIPRTVSPLFIDGRLEAEQLQIFCVDGNNSEAIEKYKDTLFDDSKVQDAPCSMKQTSHVAAMIASHMVGFFTNHITNINSGEIIREVPFYYEYFVPINLTNDTYK